MDFARLNLSSFLPKFEGGETEGEKVTDHPLKERIVGALSYFYFVAPLLLLFSPNASSFIKFHARHGLFISLLAILSLLLPAVPKLICFGLLTTLLVYLAALAFNGRVYWIPFVTSVVRNFEI